MKKKSPRTRKGGKGGGKITRKCISGQSKGGEARTGWVNHWTREKEKACTLIPLTVLAEMTGRNQEKREAAGLRRTRVGKDGCLHPVL